MPHSMWKPVTRVAVLLLGISVAVDASGSSQRHDLLQLFDSIGKVFLVRHRTAHFHSLQGFFGQLAGKEYAEYESHENGFTLAFDGNIDPRMSEYYAFYPNAGMKEVFDIFMKRVFGEDGNPRTIDALCLEAAFVESLSSTEVASLLISCR